MKTVKNIADKMEPIPNMNSAPVGIWYNTNFITAIDWGVRFPVSIFNSACQGVNIDHPLKNQLRELRRNIEYSAETFDKVVDLEKYLPKRKKGILLKRISNTTEDIKKNLNTMIGVDCWAIANLVLDNCPYGSYIALEDHECLKNTFTRDYDDDKWMKDMHLDLLYWVMCNLAKRKGIKMVYVDKTNSSITCPSCGNIDKKARDKDAHVYRCKKCGFVANDDITAAMNIYKRAEHTIFGQSYMNMKTAASCIPKQPATYIPMLPQ